MEDIQIFKILDIDNRPSTGNIDVWFELEGQAKETTIRNEDLASFIVETSPKETYSALSGLLQKDVSFDADMVPELDHDTLIHHVHGFLFKNLSVALRIENRKLRDENDSLRSRLNLAMVQLGVIDVHIDYFNGIMRHVRNLPKTPDIANNDIIQALKDELEDACYKAVMCFNEDKQWIKEKVLQMKDLPNEIRKSA